MVIWLTIQDVMIARYIEVLIFIIGFSRLLDDVLKKNTLNDIINLKE